MSSGFHRGGFENATVVHGSRTSLRPVEEHDVDLLLEWHADDGVARYWDWESFTREEMVERLGRDDVTPYVVLEGERPVGYLQVHSTGLDMFLIPSARGRGLGPDAAAAMARHLLDERGYERVTVDPYAWNEPGLRGWRNAGFVEVSRHPADDEHLDEWVLMVFSPR